MENYNITELISASGILVGRKQVVKAISEIGGLRCVILADDADKPYRDNIAALCREYGVEMINYPSGAELGRLCKIAVSCSAVGIKK